MGRRLSSAEMCDLLAKLCPGPKGLKDRMRLMDTMQRLQDGANW